MKKFLAGTTALVAAVAFTAQAEAAEKIQIKIGGFMTQYVGFVDNDDASGTSENYADVYTGADTELYFRGSTTLDNGLKVTVNIDQEVDRNATGNSDDIFLAISSDTLGKVEIGATKAVAYDMSITAPVGGIGLSDSDYTYFTDTAFLGIDTVDRLGTLAEDGQKINYFSPKIAGFQLGLTYGLVPTSVNGGSLDTNGNSAADTELAAGLAYSGEFSGVGVALAGTYSTEFAGGTGGTGTGTGANSEDETTYTIGAEVSVAGFTVGGGYTEVEDFGGVNDNDVEMFDIGVAYATGPYTISAGYMNVEDDQGTTADDDDDLDIFVGAVEYDLGGGITASASVYSVENENKDAAANLQDREGFGVVAGIHAKF